MGKTNRIIITIVITLLVFLGIVTFVVSNKINLTQIKSTTKRNLETAFPNSKVEVGKIDHSFGTSIRIYLNKIKVTDSNKNTTLEIKKFSIKFPITSLLINKGDINLQAEHLVLNLNRFVSVKNKNNESSELTKLIKKNIHLPAFVRKSKVHLKIINSKLLNRETDIHINKVIIKDLNFQKTTAFEIETFFKTNIPNVGHVESNIQVIGELNLSKYLIENKLAGKFVVKSKNLKVNNEAPSVNSFKQKVSFIYNSKKFQEIESEISNELFSLTVKGTEFKDVLKFSQFYLDINTGIFRKDSLIDFNKSRLIVEGMASFNLDRFTLNPQVKFKTNKNIYINLGKFDKIETKVSGEIKNNMMNSQLELTVKDKQIKANLELKVKDYLSNQIEAIGLDTTFEGIDFSKEEIQAFLETQVKFPKIKSIKTKLEGKNLSVNDIPFGVKMISEVENHNLKSLNLRISEGSGTLKAQVKKQTVFVTLRDIRLDFLKLGKLNNIPFEKSKLRGKLEFNMENLKPTLKSLYISGKDGYLINEINLDIPKKSEIKRFDISLVRQKKSLLLKNLSLNGRNNKLKIKSSGKLLPDNLNIKGSINLNKINIPFRVGGSFNEPKLEILKDK